MCVTSIHQAARPLTAWRAASRAQTATSCTSRRRRLHCSRCHPSNGVSALPELSQLAFGDTAQRRRRVSTSEIRWFAGVHVCRGIAPGMDCSFLEPVSSTFEKPQSFLRVEPFGETSQSELVRQVLTPLWSVRHRSAAPTDRHPPVCLWSMMLVELGTYVRCVR